MIAPLKESLGQLVNYLAHGLLPLVFVERRADVLVGHLIG